MNRDKHEGQQELPSDGLKGLIENFPGELSSGFTVFLIALPLSLGIAKASDFPPLMGLLTAIIGGLVVSFFAGSRLTIKGPAAGLIVIVAGAVQAFGGGELGWHLTLGALVVAGLLQVLMGVLRMGSLVDFFPLSAVHGMLGAIGIIIIAKQVPVLLGVDPSMAAGMGPVELLLSLPSFVMNANPMVALVGIVSLAIIFVMPKLQVGLLKKIPAPIFVLLFAIPAQLLLDFRGSQPATALVALGDFAGSIRINADFGGVAHLGTFLKYVVMFTLVGSLESLLTVKAIDLADPYKRRSNSSRDLIAIGIGNTLAAFLGGLPMISEVARSSANVANGARTRWSNFFHGFFILSFVLLATPVIEMIPNAALAAMLISVGVRLAHPSEFKHTFSIGRDQLAIYITTIAVTLWEDLLLGIAAGIALKIVLHLSRGVSLKSLFFSACTVQSFGDRHIVVLERSAVFSNYIAIKNKLDAIPRGGSVTIDLRNSELVDHTVMESLSHFKEEYEGDGIGSVEITGLDQLRPISAHPHAARFHHSYPH